MYLEPIRLIMLDIWFDQKLYYVRYALSKFYLTQDLHLAAGYQFFNRSPTSELFLYLRIDDDFQLILTGS